MDDNIILLTDSYKVTHWKQYPPNTTFVYSYLESRHGGKFSKTLFFGLQYIIKRYLVGRVITKEKIEEAEKFFNQHLGNGLFNKAGWQHILDKHDGRLPVRIRAVPEGTIVPTGNVLVTIENTDPECFWLTNYLETILLHVWYGTTVATLSYHMKETIHESLVRSGTPDAIPFKLHDFGFRGVSSVESAGMGGAAHLLNFLGTDTLAAISLTQRYYNAQGMPAFSIAASEHSTITSWGRECEVDAMENMLDQYPEGLVACVSDSYDIINACKNLWGGKLKAKVLARKGTLVIRPDSGVPEEIVPEVLEALGEAFGYTINTKGFKVLPDQVRVIQGDGVDDESIKDVIAAVEAAGWSMDNLAFGCGGALLQKMNRDTQRFAFKCSAIVVNDELRDVYKAPVTDPTKNSKRGKMKLVLEKGWNNFDSKLERLVTAAESDPRHDVMQTVFLNGHLMMDDNLEDIRVRASE